MFKKGDKAIVTSVDRDDMNVGVRVGDTVFICEDNNPMPWCIRENGKRWPLYAYQLELAEESKKDERVPKAETQPMVVNISIGVEPTHITRSGMRFHLVAED